MMAGIIYLALGLGIVGTAVVAAAVYDDATIMNKGGALLAAVAAMLVMYEAFFEERMRSVRAHRGEGEQGGGEGWSRLSPRWRLAERLRIRRWRGEEMRLSATKVRLIVLTGVLAVVGELLHGFGDVLYKSIGRSGVEAMMLSLRNILGALWNW